MADGANVGRAADERPATTGGRALIVSSVNPFGIRGGASEYVASVARILGDLHDRLDLAVLNGVERHQLRTPEREIADYLALFDRVSFRRAVRAGGYFWATHPDHVLGRLQRAFGAPAADPLRDGWLPLPDARQRAWAAAIVRRSRPDLLVANYFNAAFCFAAAPPGAIKCLIVHDVLALRARAYAEAGVASDIRPSSREEEIAAFDAADICFAIKEEEADYIRAHAPRTRVVVAPHSLGPATPDLDAPRPQVALFVGTPVPANVDALTWLLEEVWPRTRAAAPAARLRVVGKIGVDWRGPRPDGVDFVGFVDDLCAEYAGAMLALAPIRYGSGLKIKLAEALAHGVPVVTTAVGAEGIAPAPARALTVAETPEALAAAAAAHLSDPDAVSARRAARALGAERFGRPRAERAIREALDL